MSANFENKKVVVSEIENLAKDAKSIVLVDYRGLTVAQANELRNDVRSAGGVYKVYKNRLLKIAFEQLGISFPAETYEGMTALATSEDVVAPAKIAIEGETAYKVMKVKAGVIEGKVSDYAYIKQIASIPSKEVLVAQLLGMLLNPIRSLAVVLNEAAKKQEAYLKLKEKKEAEIDNADLGQYGKYDLTIDPKYFNVLGPAIPSAVIPQFF